MDEDPATMQLNFRMLIPTKEAGTIIGKGGVNIKSIREQSGCNVSISDVQPGMTDRLTTITGTASGINRALELALTVLEEDPQAQAGALADQPAMRDLKCVMSNNEVGRIIGKAGSRVKEIREASGASVKMDADSGGQDRLVTVGGTKAAIVHAHMLIFEVVAAMGPQTALPKRQAVAAPAAYGQPQGYPGYPQQQAAYGQPQAYQQAAYYGQQAAGYAAYGQQVPQQYAPQPGYGQPQTGSAAPAGVASDLPPCTLEQLVNQDGAGRLIGRAGTGIRELREACRAQIKIGTECEPGTEYRKVTVSGSLDDVRNAINAILQRLSK